MTDRLARSPNEGEVAFLRAALTIAKFPRLDCEAVHVPPAMLVALLDGHEQRELERAELLEALRELLESAPGGRDDATCHLGITTRDKCRQCHRVDRARALLSRLSAQDRHSAYATTPDNGTESEDACPHCGKDITPEEREKSREKWGDAYQSRMHLRCGSDYEPRHPMDEPPPRRT
jgi:hypothetical protein